MSNPDIIAHFIKDFTAETTPAGAAKIPDFREHLREGTVVYITFLPGSDFNDTVDVAVRLRKEGFIPVPHFAARSITNEKVLEDNIKRIVGEADVDAVLAIAGALDKPLGSFQDSMQLLNTGLFEKHGIKRIAVAGHPEGSPDMHQDAILDAMRWKNNYAEQTGTEMYMVTQFAFDVTPIITWDKYLQSQGNKLPIHVGVPGLATLKSLIMHAKHCGVGASMRVLTKQAKNLSKLLVVNTPDQQISDLAHYKMTDPNCGISGVHMYPLGGLPRTAQWSYAVAEGRIEMRNSGGFNSIAHIW